MSAGKRTSVRSAAQNADRCGIAVKNVADYILLIGNEVGYLLLDYICGFEESYGYITETYVRDKEALNAAFIICEMFAYYKTRNISLIDKLNEIYDTRGYTLQTLHSYEFEGSLGMIRMQNIMSDFRNGINEIAGIKVNELSDYEKGLDGLPKSDVLKFRMHDSSVVVRPSGTEPKLKTYISVTADNKEKAEEIENSITESLEKIIKD